MKKSRSLAEYINHNTAGSVKDLIITVTRGTCNNRDNLILVHSDINKCYMVVIRVS